MNLSNFLEDTKSTGLKAHLWYEKSDRLITPCGLARFPEGTNKDTQYSRFKTATEKSVLCKRCPKIAMYWKDPIWHPKGD